MKAFVITKLFLLLFSLSNIGYCQSSLFSKKDNGFVFVFIENDCASCNVMTSALIPKLAEMNQTFSSIVVSDNKRIYKDFIEYGLPKSIQSNSIRYINTAKLKEKMRSDLYYVENGKIVYSYYEYPELINLYSNFTVIDTINFPNRIPVNGLPFFKVIYDSLIYYTTDGFNSFYGLLSLKNGNLNKEKIVNEVLTSFVPDTARSKAMVFWDANAILKNNLFVFFGTVFQGNKFTSFQATLDLSTNVILYKTILSKVFLNGKYPFSFNDPIIRNGDYFYNITLDVAGTKEFYEKNKFLPSFIKLKNGDSQQLSLKGKMPDYYVKNWGYINNWKTPFTNEGLGLYAFKRYPAILDTSGRTIMLKWKEIENEDNVKYQNWDIMAAINYGNNIVCLMNIDNNYLLVCFDVSGKFLCSRKLKDSGSLLSLSENGLYELIPKDMKLQKFTLRKMKL